MPPDELQAHLLALVSSNDLDQASCTTALLPEALAMLAHVTTGGHTPLFANDLPWCDRAQNQPTLSLGPKDALLFATDLLLGIFARHRVHSLNGDGRAWLVWIFHQQRGFLRGVAPTAAAPKAGAPTGKSGSKPNALMASSE